MSAFTPAERATMKAAVDELLDSIAARCDASANLGLNIWHSVAISAAITVINLADNPAVVLDAFLRAVAPHLEARGITLDLADPPPGTPARTEALH